MNMATFLKGAANLMMAVSLFKLLAHDLGEEVRQDAAGVGQKTQALVRRSPYRAAASAAALGLLTGFLLSQPRHPPAQ